MTVLEFSRGKVRVSQSSVRGTGKGKPYELLRDPTDLLDYTVDRIRTAGLVNVHPH